jgi:hypothetical protein
LADGESTVPPGQAGAEIFNCPDDYIVIGGIRLCGDKFNDGSLIEDFTMNAPVTGEVPQLSKRELTILVL